MVSLGVVLFHRVFVALFWGSMSVMNETLVVICKNLR